MKEVDTAMSEIANQNAVVNWLARVFLDTTRSAGYIVAEMDRRLPNRECSIGITSAESTSLMNRAGGDIDETIKLFQELRSRAMKSPDAELFSYDRDFINYCVKIPEIPGRNNLMVLSLSGPANKVMEDVTVVWNVLGEVERQLEAVQQADITEPEPSMQERQAANAE